jgi:hypothetical protein
MAAEAKMLGAWIFINNPKRSTSEDLNLQVGGTVKLNTEALNLLAKQLLTIKIEVMDEDTFSDDLLLTNDTFQLGFTIPTIIASLLASLCPTRS